MTALGRKICRFSAVILLSCFVVLAAGAYLFYQDLKKDLVGRLSERAGYSIGHTVRIGDISLRPFSEIILHDIAIENPEGFEKGDLLRIRKLTLGIRPRELFHQRFSFSDIVLQEPEMILQRDGKGRLNISDRFRAFLSAEPTLEYRIDQLRIISGFFTLGSSSMLQSIRLDLTMHDMSPLPDTRTTLRGRIALPDNTAAEVSGWVYPKRKAKDFGITIAADSLRPSAVQEYLRRYGISVENTDLSMVIHAEGDSEKSFTFSSEAVLKKAGLPFFRKSPEISMTLQARYDIREDAVSIEDLSLAAGKGSSVNVTGKIRDLRTTPSYSAVARIGRFDLVQLNIMKGVEVGGIVSADRIVIQGLPGRTLPSLSGAVQVDNAIFRAAGVDVEKIRASASFATGKQMSVILDASGSLTGLRGYLAQPSHVDLSLRARGKPEDAEITSSVHISPFVMPVSERSASIKDLRVSAEGRFTAGRFQGRAEVETADFRYGDYGLNWLKSTFGVDGRKDLVTVRGLRAESEVFRATSDSLLLDMAGSGKVYTAAVRDVHISYPRKEAEVMNLDAEVRLDTGKKNHEVGFSFRKASFREIAAQEVKGRARWQNETISLDLVHAGIAGGRVSLSAETKKGKDLFPLSVAAAIEDADIKEITRMLAGFLSLPYDLSGEVRKAALEGVVESLQSVRGRGSLLAEKVSVAGKEKKRFLLRNASLKSNITLLGRDVDVTADIDIAKVAASLSGSLKNYPSADRAGLMRIVLPEVRGADIREAFWDIFPDSLLYAGIEGSLSSDVTVDFSREGTGARGYLAVKDLTIEGENGEFTAGPVSGTIPFNSEASGNSETTHPLPSFAPAAFQELREFYSAGLTSDGAYSTIRISSFRYGFELLEDITLQVRQTGRLLNVGRFSATIFGGRLHGSAVLDLSDGLRYRGGAVLDDMSLTKLCDIIEPLRGYLSGRVSGTVGFQGSGTEVSGLAGKADFWTYDTEDEKRKISREFLLKIGGPTARIYLGDRRFDKGVMTAYLKDGSVIFRELEISNRNFLGIRDLSIKVAPMSNRISLDHLLWTIAEAADRAKDK